MRGNVKLLRNNREIYIFLIQLQLNYYNELRILLEGGTYSHLRVNSVTPIV